MADILNFSESPSIRVTDADLTNNVVFQRMMQAIDVSRYDQLDLLLVVTSFEGSATGVAVEVWTGMQNKVDDGWVQLYSFGSITTPMVWQKAVIGPWFGLLRYVRWKVTSLLGSASPRAASFSLSGMARTGF